jgi:prevent-host-death family protein
MSINLAEDIRSVTDLKRHTREIIDQVHQTGRPVVLTVNGKADVVLMDVASYEQHLKAANLSRILEPAEEEVTAGRTRPAREFLEEFTRARTLPS